MLSGETMPGNILDQLVLASASPRRKQLLAQIGVRCRVLVSNIDETPLPEEVASVCAARLALEKAKAVVSDDGLPVMGADTVVVKDGLMLGKPKGQQDAVEMLQRLQGGEHEVITAVALFWQGQEFVEISTSTVFFKPLSVAECEAYWLTGEPEGKAGAYAIQGLAAIFVERIEGSFSGVMGLPLFESSRLLDRVGINALRSYR